jgi:hypothetical protein
MASLNKLIDTILISDKPYNSINGTEGSAPYFSRIDWLAQPEVKSLPLKLPVTYYIISHSATTPCFTQPQCVFQVKIL